MRSLSTPEDYLATNIRSNGSREFYYTVTMPDRQNTKKGAGGKNVSGAARVSGGSSSNTRAGAGITVGGSGNVRKILGKFWGQSEVPE